MSDKFDQVVRDYGPKLEAEFGLSAVQAAGIWGNLGHESGGFKFFAQVGSSSRSGGRGWGQWTGPRRVSFLAWCKAHRLEPTSDAANFGYLCFELHGAYASVVSALKRCANLATAVSTFERRYEGAGIVAMASRESWGRRALAILSPGHAQAAEPPRRGRALAKKSRRTRNHHHG